MVVPLLLAPITNIMVVSFAYAYRGGKGPRSANDEATLHTPYLRGVQMELWNYVELLGRVTNRLTALTQNTLGPESSF